jgi:hypothetical protein
MKFGSRIFQIVTHPAMRQIALVLGIVWGSINANRSPWGA